MNGSAPRIAVIGRQNVGKSTLVNRLFGRREAIAHPMAGVTRDRIELDAVWNGRRFTLIDTGGYAHGARGIESKVGDQAARAAAEADLILLVVDARSGITQEDDDLAKVRTRLFSSFFLVCSAGSGVVCSARCFFTSGGLDGQLMIWDLRDPFQVCPSGT